MKGISLKSETKALPVLFLFNGSILITNQTKMFHTCSMSSLYGIHLTSKPNYSTTFSFIDFQPAQMHHYIPSEI